VRGARPIRIATGCPLIPLLPIEEKGSEALAFETFCASTSVNAGTECTSQNILDIRPCKHLLEVTGFPLMRE